jgi:osmoprotectant transport system substrate-binding protein
MIIFSVLSFSLQAYAEDREITLGGKNFTEQYLLTELAGILLEKSGFKVNMKTGVGSVIARKSLENGQFDLYFEYTGTAYTVYFAQKDREIMADPDKVYQWVKKADENKGLIWLDPILLNNTYTVMMRQKQAEALGIKTISDLAAYVNTHPDELEFALESEFWERPDGFKEMMKHYGFRLPPGQVKKMSVGLTYQALKNGHVNSAMGFATDGRIAAFGFTSLTDDKSFFPVYNPAPVVRKKILDTYPQIRSLLKPLAASLTTYEVRILNSKIDVEHEPVRKTAEAWLRSKDLIK